MKKLFTFFFLLIASLCFSYTIEPDNSEPWKKIKEEDNLQEFISPSGSLFSISIEPVLPTSYHPNPLWSDPPTAFSWLDKMPSSSLQKMKQLRNQWIKEKNPHSNWKLLYAFTSDDIIYTHSSPAFGPNPATYELTRLVKKESVYIKISYVATTPLSQEQMTKWLHHLQQITLS